MLIKRLVGVPPWAERIQKLIVTLFPRFELPGVVRVSFGLDRYTSLAASADGRRVVATLAGPKGTLWRVPVSSSRAEMSAARRIPLNTRSGSSPRFGAGHLLYVSSKPTGDSIWRLQGETASEVWSAPDAQIVGAPAVATKAGSTKASSSKPKASRGTKKRA